MSKKLTAVEWFLNELLKNNIIEISDVDIDTYSKARDMEAEQKINDWTEGYEMGYEEGDRI
jgi:hypothetical protein